MKLTKAFIEDIRELIRSARVTMARNVDLVQVYTNFEIGHRIVKEEQRGKDRAAYGEEIIKELASRLTDEFGKGFSVSNLAYMRSFYVAFKDRIQIFQSVTGKSELSTKIQSMTGKSVIPQKLDIERSQLLADQYPIPQARSFILSWTHYVFLLGIKDPDERSFYEIEATAQNWSVRELKRQFDSSLYERLALSRDKNGVRKLAQEGQIINKPKDVLKEPLVLEFLGLSEEARYSESDLETAIINHIERFLLELGKGFLFESRQKRFTFESDHFFVDLVFYNRLLRCYVLIDLKIGKLAHQDLGQMQMYVNYFDRYVKKDDENPTVGIILCKRKHEALVEITLPKETNIHAREYRLYLPSKAELRKKLIEWSGQRDAKLR